MSEVRQRGFVSLPILLLSFSIAGMTMIFYEKVSDSKKWQALQAPMVGENAVWTQFSVALLSQIDTSKAVLSSCNGFCPIDENTNWPYEFQINRDVKLFWNLETVDFLSTTPDEVVWYRACAYKHSSLLPKNLIDGQNLKNIHCWWLKERANQYNLMSHIHIQ